MSTPELSTPEPETPNFFGRIEAGCERLMNLGGWVMIGSGVSLEGTAIVDFVNSQNREGMGIAAAGLASVALGQFVRKSLVLREAARQRLQTWFESRNPKSM